MKHLTTRLVILLMLAFMAITGAYDYVRLVRERERLIDQTRQDVRIFAETLALAVRRNIRRGRTTEELQELLREILARPGLVRVAIYDPQGQVVITSAADDTGRLLADQAIGRVLRQREPTSLFLTDGEHQVLEYVQPFRWPDGRTAAVEVRQSLTGVEQEFAEAIRERIVSRLVVLAFFVLSIVAVTRWSIARPIRTLIRGARAVGAGDLAQRIDVRRADELGQLAEEFNRMGESLQRAQLELVRESEERLHLEQEVQQAHEVGTPLNVISGRAEALLRAIAPDHPGRRHLDVILKQTERITGIIRALLDYTRPRRPALAEEALPPILARVADLVAGRCRERDVRIEIDLPAEPPRVRADADQLQQAFLNLLVNAIDASPPGGLIRVTEGAGPVLPPAGRAGITRGKAEAPWVALHVVDQGRGMSEAELAHVFQPFVSTKDWGQGTGLGLPIVEEIVRAHRGEVEILSRPGAGTEVIVRLPVASGASPEADALPDDGGR
jgi:signal transduction histidine kinase